MKKLLLKDFLLSFEWRIISFITTGIIFYIAFGDIKAATALNILIHSILLVEHWVWLMIRVHAKNI